MYEICEQFELAIEYIAEERNITISAAFELFATGFLTLIGNNCTPAGGQQDCRTAIGLLECLRERVIPLLVAEQAQIQQILSQNQASTMQMTDTVQQWNNQQSSNPPNTTVPLNQKYPALNTLLEHPNLKALLENPELDVLIENNDVNALLEDPNVKALLEDPDVNALLEDPTVKAQLENPTISAPTGLVP